MNWRYMTTRGRVWIILIGIWWTIALTIWIIALVNLSNGGFENGYWGAAFLCAIPIAFPLIRFVFRIASGAGLAGSAFWSVDVSSTGGVYVHNHGLFWWVIAFIIAGALAIISAPFVLPIFLIYYTVIVLIALFRR